MLVVRGNRGEFSPTEQLVVDWLQVQDLPGLVLAGCRVAGPQGLRRLINRGVEADLLIVTERTCLVLEVENLSEPVAGTVQCPVDGPWRMVGVDGDPVPVRMGDTNPFERVLEAVEATREIASDLDPGLPGCVLGLLVVVPFPGYPVTLNVDRALLPEGTEILLADEPHELHDWVAAAGDRFEVTRRCDARWTADRVTALLTTLLGDRHGVTGPELTAAGFAGAQPNAEPGRPRAAETYDDRSRAVAAPAAAPHTGEPATPGQPTADPAAPARSAAAENRGGATALRPNPRTPDERLAAATRRNRRVSLLSAAAALIAVVLGLWVFSSCAEPSTPAESTPLPAEPVVNRPAPPPPPEPADPTCYPFQPAC